MSGQQTGAALLFALCLFLVVGLSGCWDAEDSSSDTGDTGGIAFSVEWKGAPTTESATRAVDCFAAGIDAVTFEVYDEYNSYLTGDSWPCSYGEGTVDGVRAGTNRRLVVSAMDSGETVLYQGERGGITVTAGQTTHIGEVVVQPVNSVPTASITSPTDGSIYNEGADILFIGFGNDNEDGALSGSSLVWKSSRDGQIGIGLSLTLNDLSAGSHTITLTATDSHGGAGSDSVSMTVNALPNASITRSGLRRAR